VSLKTWCDAGWIHAVPADPELVSRLLESAKDNLRQCRLEGLSPEWRLIIAYTVILNAATAALSASGYRADRDQHHFRTLQSLEYTVGLQPAVLRQLDGFRKKRHVSTYDPAGSVSDLEVREIVHLASSLLEQIVSWLRSEHPGLL
jgi:hypothetical protein